MDSKDLLLKKVKLKKIKEVDEFTVWEVDGKLIRDSVDREFTNFAQHYRFPFIPLLELWIDKEHDPGECDYYVDHLIEEWYLMRAGFSYPDALLKADRKEIKERSKSAFLKKIRSEIKKDHKYPQELVKKRLDFPTKLEILIVNGEVVRDLFFIDFTEGGHHFVYDFVPYNQVWIDDDLSKDEYEFVLLHELHERKLMSKGMDYNHAHRSSSLLEYKCRNNILNIKYELKKEVEDNESISMAR